MNHKKTATPEIVEAIPVPGYLVNQPNNTIPIATIVQDQQAICRDCRQPFTRLEKNRGGASYFRCPNCQKTFLTRSVLTSCLIS